MTHAHPNILWYDRIQRALEACRRTALRAGDQRTARRALMLRLWANDRAELLAERTG